MRMFIFIGLMLVVGFADSGAPKAGGKQYLVPKENGVPVYADKTRDDQKFNINTNDRLTQLSASRDRYQVRTSNGKTGWVIKSDVKKVTASKQFVFDNASVQGYLDNPTPVYIIDADDAGDAPIRLDHSFSDALRVNVDKFGMQRIANRDKASNGTLPF